MNKNYSPEDAITTVTGIGPATAEKLNKLGISTIGDLLRHYPVRFIDFTTQATIKQLKNKKEASFIARIDGVKTFFTANKKLLTQATARDKTGTIKLTWFNNPYIKRLIKEGETYSIAGKPSFFGPGLTIISPVIEEGDSSSINTSGLVPIFPQTAGITSRWLRTKIFSLLSQTNFEDPIEEDLIIKNKILPIGDAYLKIHFPKTKIERWQADKRLAYNEHLRINIQNKLELEKLGPSISISINQSVDKKTESLIPFKITTDQQKTIDDIYKDLQSDTYTHRLVQGDTGSGKTITLVFAANQCLEGGFSAAILAPTEILANQHYETFRKYALNPQSVSLVTSHSEEEPNAANPTIYIGTHALINRLPQKLKHPLALLAIDEQHKFGVKQRNELLQRTPIPHLFNLSATPIPRTVALGLLGDIAVSNIKHKPQNRLPTKTYVTPPTRFQNSTDWLIEQLESGNQIFVVCPNITDHTEKVASVDSIFKSYRRKIPDKFPIWSLHGQIKTSEQHQIIQDFTKSKTGILVSTSLIEVGIDIPAANVMVIHSAERFGLAGLHQLRGRVGRGDGQGYCFLVPSTDDEIETARLQLLQKYDSGLILAQKDLRLRGAGEVFGIRQHGLLATRLKYFWSKPLFLLAKQDAHNLVLQSPEKAGRIATKLTSC
jgi:ATP-dependent DNA helicase RecG